MSASVSSFSVSAIPHDEFLRIAERLCDGSHTIINKDVIRSVLRSLNMQLYIEKWLQIIQRSLIEPPKPGFSLLHQLDDMFQELQTPFNNYKAERRELLNYNYVFCRLFQKIGCHQFSMFFTHQIARQATGTGRDVGTNGQSTRLGDYTVASDPIICCEARVT